MKRESVVVGNPVLTIFWHLLSDPDAHFHNLSSDHYQAHLNARPRQRDLIRQLEHLTGQAVILGPTA